MDQKTVAVGRGKVKLAISRLAASDAQHKVDVEHILLDCDDAIDANLLLATLLSQLGMPHFGERTAVLQASGEGRVSVTDSPPIGAGTSQTDMPAHDDMDDHVTG